MSVLPDYIELESDELEEEVETEEPTSDTWMLDEMSHTIRPISDDRRECIIQAIKCALRTEQQEYEMYSIDYGSTLHERFGDTKPHVYAEIEQCVKKCLLRDERISAVNNFEFEDRKGNIIVRFDVITSDETVRIEEEVNYG